MRRRSRTASGRLRVYMATQDRVKRTPKLSPLVMELPTQDQVASSQVAPLRVASGLRRRPR